MDLLSTLVGEPFRGLEIGRMNGKREHSRERIWMFSPDDTELLRKGGSNRPRLVSHLLVNERVHKWILSELLSEPNGSHLKWGIRIRWRRRKAVDKREKLGCDRTASSRIREG